MPNLDELVAEAAVVVIIAALEVGLFGWTLLRAADSAARKVGVVR